MQDLTTLVSLHPLLSLAAVIVLLLLIIIELIRAKRTNATLSPMQATQMLNHEHAVIIDTRSKDAYCKGHIIDALSLPLTEIKTATKKIEKFKNRPIIVVCGTGLESQKLAASWLKQGYNARALSGGMRAWSDAHMPVVKE